METFYGTTLLAGSHYYIKLRLALSENSLDYLKKNYPQISYSQSRMNKDKTCAIFKIELVIPKTSHYDWLYDLAKVKLHTKQSIIEKLWIQSVLALDALEDSHFNYSKAEPEDFTFGE